MLANKVYLLLYMRYGDVQMTIIKWRYTWLDKNWLKNISTYALMKTKH